MAATDLAIRSEDDWSFSNTSRPEDRVRTCPDREARTLGPSALLPPPALFASQCLTVIVRWSSPRLPMPRLSIRFRPTNGTSLHGRGGYGFRYLQQASIKVTSLSAIGFGFRIELGVSSIALRKRVLVVRPYREVGGQTIASIKHHAPARTRCF